MSEIDLEQILDGNIFSESNKFPTDDLSQSIEEYLNELNAQRAHDEQNHLQNREQNSTEYGPAEVESRETAERLLREILTEAYGPNLAALQGHRDYFYLPLSDEEVYRIVDGFDWKYFSHSTAGEIKESPLYTKAVDRKEIEALLLNDKFLQRLRLTPELAEGISFYVRKIIDTVIERMFRVLSLSVSDVPKLSVEELPGSLLAGYRHETHELVISLQLITKIAQSMMLIKLFQAEESAVLKHIQELGELVTHLKDDIVHELGHVWQHQEDPHLARESQYANFRANLGDFQTYFDSNAEVFSRRLASQFSQHEIDRLKNIFLQNKKIKVLDFRALILRAINEGNFDEVVLVAELSYRLKAPITFSTE